jgi:hypothetical protein
MAYKKLFPAQEATERVFLLIRRHWFTYVMFGFFGLIVPVPIIVAIIFWIYTPDLSPAIVNIFILGGSVYALSALAVLLYGFVDYYLDIYIVTDRRIVGIKQNGFFRREISELYLREVQDVKAKVEGLFPTTLHYGQVIVQTAAEIDNFIFDSVPHPYEISKKIIDLHEITVGEQKPNLRLSSSRGIEAKNDFLELKGYSMENDQMEVNEEPEGEPVEILEDEEPEEDGGLNTPSIPKKNVEVPTESIREEPAKEEKVPEKSLKEKSGSEEGTLEEGKEIDIK